MSAAHQTPLGLSDLTPGECFLIAFFRQWRRLVPTRAIAEHKLACLLQADDIHPALSSLFGLFDALPHRASDSDSETDLLSDHGHAAESFWVTDGAL